MEHKTLAGGDVGDQKFDQFKNKKTDFDMNIYSVDLPEKLDKELEERGKRIELELQNKQTKDIEKYGEDDENEDKTQLEDDEKKFGTANARAKANYELFNNLAEND